MKKYSTPNTDCIELRMMGAILVESGEGQKEDPKNPDPGMGLAPKRVF